MYYRDKPIKPDVFVFYPKVWRIRYMQYILLVYGKVHGWGKSDVPTLSYRCAI